MTAKSLTGLEKAAVLLKSLPAAVVDKVMKHMDARHAGILAAELEKLKQDSELSSKLSGVLDEAAKILEDAAKKPARPAAKTEAVEAQTPRSEKKASQVDIRLDGKPDDRPAAPTPVPQNEALRALATLPPEILAAALEVRMRGRSRCSSTASTSKLPGEFTNACRPRSARKSRCGSPSSRP